MSTVSSNASLLKTNELPDLKGARIGIVSTEWNEAIVAELIRGSKEIIEASGAEVCQEIKVPGAVEIPYACCQLARNEKLAPEAIIAFGAVIRGGTPHFEYVCDSVVQGLSSLNVSQEVPIIFGVLTLDNEAQAWERLGGLHGHKGQEAGIAALKMIAVKRLLQF